MFRGAMKRKAVYMHGLICGTWRLERLAEPDEKPSLATSPQHLHLGSAHHAMPGRGRPGRCGVPVLIFCSLVLLLVVYFKPPPWKSWRRRGGREEEEEKERKKAGADGRTPTGRHVSKTGSTLSGFE